MNTTQSKAVPLAMAADGASVRPTKAAPCLETTSFPFVWSLDRSSTVGRALLAATRRLREAGSDTPQLDTAVLMAHVLGVGKTWLYAHPNRSLTEDEIVRFEGLVRRRMHLEPVAYLVGYRPFFGLDITVDRRVLVPRPETELLVERTLSLIGLLDRGERPCVADVGTGSGAIAVALAVNAPHIQIYATDVSDDALAVAAQNVWRYGVGDQITLLPGNLLEPLPEPVDIIVGNLPYIATSELVSLPCEVKDYEPMRALDGGPDGLSIIAGLLGEIAHPAQGRPHLKPGGRILLEIGAHEGASARALSASILPGSRVEVLVDYSSLDRILLINT